MSAAAANCFTRLRRRRVHQPATEGNRARRRSAAYRRKAGKQLPAGLAPVEAGFLHYRRCWPLICLAAPTPEASGRRDKSARARR